MSSPKIPSERNQTEARPAALLVRAKHHRKILFSLGEKEMDSTSSPQVRRAQNEKGKEYFSLVFVAAGPGFGPRYLPSKGSVLPLDDPAIISILLPKRLFFKLKTVLFFGRFVDFIIKTLRGLGRNNQLREHCDAGILKFKGKESYRSSIAVLSQKAANRDTAKPKPKV